MNSISSPLTFEQSLARIEQIVASMESGKVDLDTMIKQYEEGQKLIAECQKQLTEVERRVETLIKQANGTIETKLFPEEE